LREVDVDVGKEIERMWVRNARAFPFKRLTSPAADVIETHSRIETNCFSEIFCVFFRQEKRFFNDKSQQFWQKNCLGM
jgi:hypothetical protein